MSSATVALRKSSTPAVWVQAELSLQVALVARVKSRLGESPQALYLLDGSAHPSYIPAEASTYSGGLFALRTLDAIDGPGEHYELSVHRLSGIYQPEDVEGFAHAAVVGVAYMTGHTDLITSDLLGAWQIESCSVMS